MGISEVVGEFGWFVWLLLALLCGCALRVVVILVQRGYRAIQILARGWPPSHLDADGDWKPKDGD